MFLFFIVFAYILQLMIWTIRWMIFLHSFEVIMFFRRVFGLRFVVVLDWFISQIFSLFRLTFSLFPLHFYSVHVQLSQSLYFNLEFVLKFTVLWFWEVTVWFVMELLVLLVFVQMWLSMNFNILAFRLLWDLLFYFPRSLERLEQIFEFNLFWVKFV